MLNNYFLMCETSYQRLVIYNTCLFLLLFHIMLFRLVRNSYYCVNINGGIFAPPTVNSEIISTFVNLGLTLGYPKFVFTEDAQVGHF